MDPTYIYYGNDEISLEDLLKKSAEGIHSYIEGQSWSKKKKERVYNAYNDIVSRGILGSSDYHKIDINAGLNFDQLSDKDKEAYQEAAYYLLGQMRTLPTKSSLTKKEEDAKKELPLYDNKVHTTNINNIISNTRFGGQSYDLKTLWEALDTRDETTGALKRDNRTKELISALENYKKTLPSLEGKYNFEGSPFSGTEDVKNRIDNAIKALSDYKWTPEDEEALDKLGIDWRNRYLRDGLDDPIGQTADGKVITYRDYYKNKNNQLPLQPIQQQNNLTYQIPDFGKVENYKQSLNDKYLNTPDGEGWSTADIAELTAIGADIASIIDPEPWSAAGLGLVGSVGRHVALLLLPEITAGDTAYQVFDYLSSLVGAIPFLGDSIIGVKAVKSLSKFAPKILKYAARPGAWYTIVTNAPGSYEALEKITKGESLTPGDWKALGRMFLGIATHGVLNRQNIKAKQILTSRGVDLKRPVDPNRGFMGKLKDTWLSMKGWTAPKATNYTGSVKVKVKNGNEEKIVEVKGLKEEEIHNLELEFIKLGNGKGKEKLETLKKNPEFIRAAKEAGINLENISEVVTNDSWRNIASNKISWLRIPKRYGTTGDTFTLSPSRSKIDNFKNYYESLSPIGRRPTRYIDKYLENNGWYGNNAEPSIPHVEPFTAVEVGLPKGTNIEGYIRNSLGLTSKYTTRSTRRFITKGKEYNEKMNVTPEETLDIKVSNTGDLIIKDKSGKIIKSEKLDPTNYAFDAKRKISDAIIDFRSQLLKDFKIRPNEFTKEFILSVKDLKKKGFLYKQGGNINIIRRNSINTFKYKYKNESKT